MTLNSIISAGLARQDTAAACGESFQLRQLAAADQRRHHGRVWHQHRVIARELAAALAAQRYAADWAFREGDFGPRRSRLTHTEA